MKIAQISQTVGTANIAVEKTATLSGRLLAPLHKIASIGTSIFSKIGETFHNVTRGLYNAAARPVNYVRNIGRKPIAGTKETTTPVLEAKTKSFFQSHKSAILIGLGLSLAIAACPSVEVTAPGLAKVTEVVVDKVAAEEPSWFVENILAFCPHFA